MMDTLLDDIGPGTQPSGALNDSRTHAEAGVRSASLGGVMRWAWSVGRVFGVDVRLHVTLILFLIWIAFGDLVERRSATGTLVGILFSFSVLLSVLSHELGHVLAARWFRASMRETTVLPIGGTAGPASFGQSPAQQIAIAIAGPLVSLVIAADLYIALWFAGHVQSFTGFTFMTGPFFERLMLANLAVALVNLLPVLPMDGGRVVRALLATRVSFVRATAITARLGQGTAAAIGLWGLFAEPMLVLVAVAVWMGAAHEMRQARADADGDHQS